MVQRYKSHTKDLTVTGLKQAMGLYFEASKHWHKTFAWRRPQIGDHFVINVSDWSID